MNFLKDLLCITYTPKKAIENDILSRIYVRSGFIFISLVMSVISLLLFISESGYEINFLGILIVIIPMLLIIFAISLIISAGFYYLIDRILAKKNLSFRNCCKEILPENLVGIPISLLRLIILYAGLGTTGIVYLSLSVIQSVWGLCLTIYYLKYLHGYDKRPIAVVIGITIANIVFSYGSKLIEAIF